ncbi:RB1-inducible coiled-coil protein 1 isoform X2 [Manduca sexta]|uniref:RB1-inducible coiled-coil protein 1 isoform X2 n=1 Tax=Manduca sexta TaxID=7130 RepID=UPI00188FC4F3|nr:RB1-inducible coiled-coil protein 1 isoform X2 [Manduca sexta]
MLYVFHVDAGQMTTYDMSLTLQNVASLKMAIEKKTKVPATSLVLLVSGGEVLQSDHMVSSYSAGTDTNPIYMFSKPSVKESRLNQSMCDLSPIVELSTGEFSSDSRSAFDSKSVAELKAQVDKCCSMSTTVHTVKTCASLAQQFSDLAHEVSRSCDQLVHEQHLQHQGWAAVVANLEDIFSEFCERSRNFKESFRKHRLKKQEYHEKLSTLNEVLESLGKIPLLPALQHNAEAHRFSAFDVFEEAEFDGHPYRISQPFDNSSENKATQDFGVEAFKLSEEDVFEQNASTSKDTGAAQSGPVEQIDQSDEGVTFKAHSYESKEEPTLLHWILAQGNKASLQDILDYCQKGLALLDAEPLKEREAELYNILEYANMHGLKHIKGIEDRLYALDQLLNDVKKLERDQHDQAASLIQCRERFNSAWDPSVLPTLVQSHWCQLKKLLKGHQTLVDIRRRIAKSKDELSHILKARLEAVLMIENSMSVQDAHAMLSFQCFGRLARYVRVLRQLHRAPAAFVRAAHEVARRRAFSRHHLAWATDLAEKLHKIHDEELNRRQEFNAMFEGHFLKSLFPGMTEIPPAFATQAPPPFDERLPKLTDADVEYIASAFPELAKDVPNYDMESTIKFFQQRISVSSSDEKDVHVQVDFDRDFESETETCDFEKLSRQNESKRIDTSTTCAPETMAVSTVTEDNMDTHKINIEKLQDFLRKLYDLCKMNVMYIMEELVTLKLEIDKQKKYVAEKHTEILEALEKCNEESALMFREQAQRLTVDHELELSDMKATVSRKDEVISSLENQLHSQKIEHQKDVERLEKEHQVTKELLEKTREEMKGYMKKIEEMEAMKQKEIKELQEKMHMDYKAEIESLRSRFRLVALTNMDRSPSESSLEKIERTDVIEISSHNAIVMQTKENAEVEKEEAVRQAVAKCEAEWKQKYEADIALLRTPHDLERQVSLTDVTRRLLTEKDRQLELAREREQALMRESIKYRDTIQQLTDPETNDCDEMLKTQMATLENEKALLQQELQELKKELEKKSEEGEKSREDDSDGRSSPKKEECSVRRRGRSHTPLGLAAGALALSACAPGATVLVLWDPAHLNYTVLQEAQIMFFVHSDCLPALDLSIQVKNESERRLYAVAVVESKEHCYAKKSGNRYNMPRGSRFCRVRVKPARLHPPPCCSADHKHKDMQKSVDTSQSTSSNTDEANKVCEVVTGALINLESPVSSSDAASTSSAPPPPEDQLDSIEAGDHWHAAKMQLSTISAVTDMECSVGRCAEPLDPCVEATALPSEEPNVAPSVEPSMDPSVQPSVLPSVQASVQAREEAAP